MIFWTWRSYFIRWQIFENKVWCPVSKKRKKVLSLFTFSCISYWQDGLDIVQCFNIVPSFVSSIEESWDSGLYFAPQLPRSFVLFYGAGRSREPFNFFHSSKIKIKYFYFLHLKYLSANNIVLCSVTKNKQCLLKTLRWTPSRSWD